MQPALPQTPAAAAPGGPQSRGGAGPSVQLGRQATAFCTALPAGSRTPGCPVGTETPFAHPSFAQPGLMLSMCPASLKHTQESVGQFAPDTWDTPDSARVLQAPYQANTCS
eukprot:3720818-Rhodomonas_salina.1